MAYYPSPSTPPFVLILFFRLVFSPFFEVGFGFFQWENLEVDRLVTSKRKNEPCPKLSNDHLERVKKCYTTRRDRGCERLFKSDQIRKENIAPLFSSHPTLTNGWRGNSKKYEAFRREMQTALRSWLSLLRLCTYISTYLVQYVIDPSRFLTHRKWW